MVEVKRPHHLINLPMPLDYVLQGMYSPAAVKKADGGFDPRMYASEANVHLVKDFGFAIGFAIVNGLLASLDCQNPSAALTIATGISGLLIYKKLFDAGYDFIQIARTDAGRRVPKAIR